MRTTFVSSTARSGSGTIHVNLCPRCIINNDSWYFSVLNNLTKTVGPAGVICLLSALSYHELTTFNPSVISMSLRRGSRRPVIIYPPVDFYHFSPEQFEAGIYEVKIGGHKVRIYCPEKTVCDCFRYRNKLGLDVAKEGLTEYLKRKDHDLEKLMESAEVCRIKPLLSIWLSALV